MARCYTYLFIYFLFFFCFAPHSYAQNDLLISFECVEAELKDVLVQWENDYDIAFAFNTHIVEEKRVSVNFEALSLEEGLAMLLKNTQIEFRIVSSRYIVLKERVRGEAKSPLTVCGQIINEENGKPLAYASVRVEGTMLGANAGENGQFEFSGSFDESQFIEISYIGFEKQLIQIKAILDELCATIKLVPAPPLVPEVIINAFTVDLLRFDNALDRISYSLKKIPTLPGWGEPDLLRSIQFLPGVSTTDESASNLNIRGGTSDQNLLLWDNIPVYHSGHFFGLYSSINPYIIDSVDIYRGTFGAEYGGRLSGVIDIKGKPRIVDEVKIGLGMNLINAHAFAEIPIEPEKLSLMVAVRRSYTDIIRSKTYQNLFFRIFQHTRVSDNIDDQSNNEEDMIIAEPNLSYFDYNIKWVWMPTEDDFLAISAYQGKDKFDYNFNEYNEFATEDNLRLSNAGISLSYEKSWNPQWKTSINTVFSKYVNEYEHLFTFDLERVPYEERYNIGNTLSDASVKLIQEWRISPEHLLEGGFQFADQNIGVNYDVFFRDGEEELYTEELLARTNSIFINYQFHPNDRWDVRFGLRKDRYKSLADMDEPILEDNVWQPRFSINFRPFDERLHFKFSGGTFRQFIYQIPTDERYLGTDQRLWVAADDHFPILTSNQWAAGVIFQENKFVFDVEFYRKNIENLSFWSLDQNRNFEEAFTREGRLSTHGLDLLIKNRWNQFSTWFAYSFARVNNSFPEINNEIPFPAENDQRHMINWTNMLALSHWDLSVSWHLGSGRPFTEPVDIEENMNEFDEIEPELVYGNPHNNRLPVYHRLDLAANYKFYTEKLSGKAGISIFNLYNRTNLLDVNFIPLGPDEEEERFESEILRLNRQMLQFTPNIFVQFEW